jgi:hypothetical protein
MTLHSILSGILFIYIIIIMIQEEEEEYSIVPISAHLSYRSINFQGLILSI